MPEPKVTLRDVAEMAHVHPATASRALNGDTRDLVKASTVKRVLDAAQALRYQPNPIARSLKTRRSHTVGVLIPDLTNPLFPPIVRGVEDRLASAGYVALLGNTDNDEHRARLVFERMLGRHVDGFIVAIAHRSDSLLLAAAGDLPIVLVNRVVEGNTFTSVSVDNSMGISVAVSHLAGIGHRRIAHVAGPQDLSTGFGRYRGFLDGMTACGLEVDPDLVVVARAFSESEGFRCGSDLLAASTEFTAVAVANDMLALGVYRALEAVGLRCPEDVSVIGFNDMPFVDRVRPPLSSIRFPHYRVGLEAAQLVLERIKDRSSPLKVLYLAPELVVRGSTAVPRVAGGKNWGGRGKESGVAAHSSPVAG